MQSQKKKLIYNLFEKTKELWRKAKHGVVRSKKTQYIFVVVVFIVTNILVQRVSFKFDFSEHKAYTLAPATKKILKNLDNTTTINLYASSDLPLALMPIKTDVVDLVGEFKKAANGKVVFKQHDPKKDPEALKNAKENGIPELQFSQIEHDRYAVSQSYFGIMLQNGDKKEIIPQATNIESLEYDLIAAIYKINRQKNNTVGIAGMDSQFLTGEDTYASAKTVLSQQFALTMIDTATNSAAFNSKETKALVVVADGVVPFSEGFIKNLDSYIQQGGKAIIMADGVAISDALEASPAQHGLQSFFAKYNMQLTSNFVLSAASEVANFTSGGVGFFANYPFWIRTTEFSSRSEFANVPTLTLPWAFEVTVPDKKNISTLVYSDNKSWLRKDTVSLLPDEVTMPDSKELRKVSLIVEAKAGKDGRLTLIPSSRFVKEQFLAPGRGNLSFLVNLVNSYASDGALSGIRARHIAVYPLASIADSVKDPIKYTSIFLLPVFFVLFGAYRLVKRR